MVLWVFGNACGFYFEQTWTATICLKHGYLGAPVHILSNPQEGFVVFSYNCPVAVSHIALTWLPGLQINESSEASLYEYRQV